MNSDEMLVALRARGPHHDIVTGNNAIYAPLAGSWQLEVFDLEADGARRVINGEWHFGWVLEGRAMQDLLMAPARGERRNELSAKGNRCATSLRIFDPASGMWRVHFFNPVNRLYEVFTAQREGKDIVQKGTDASGVSVREVFSDIAPGSFAWRREIADNLGGWKLQSEYAALRRG